MVDSIHGMPSIPPNYGNQPQDLTTLDMQIKKPLGQMIDNIQSILSNPSLLNNPDHLEQLAKNLIALNEPSLTAKNL